MRLIAEKRTGKDLFRYAYEWYGFTESEAKEILRKAGYEKFCSANWFDYMDILRTNWPHIVQLRRKKEIEILVTADQMEELRSLEQTLTIQIDPSCWKYIGTPEALDAHWKLERIRAEERMKKWRKRPCVI